ncbi:MAG: sugar transferase [Proteobacteria bacterium]|nr:sugar transferase [Pseudomonadota bacterium]
MFWTVEEGEDAFEDYISRTNKVAEENDITHVCDLWQGCFNEIADSLPLPWSTLLYRAVKRGFDFTVAAAGLAVIWPVLAATAIAVKKHLGSPILFRQERPGLDGKPFELLKFRSMANAPEGTDASHDGERLSDFGKKIRALSLDELPTLLNVLKGDMSLVGPRPLLMSYLERYNSEQIKRQWAKPGITGWAQVNGRNALSWDEKFKHDVWYVEHASPIVDLRILLLTALTVLRRDGIQHEGSATMPEFMGDET